MTPPSDSSGSASFLVVGVGASTGGLEAFTQLLQNLPAKPGLALVFIQHLEPHRESLMAALLAKVTSMVVNEAKQDQVVEPDHVYLIPPDALMSLEGGALRLQPRQDHPGSRMPVDIFFRSLARDAGERAVGIVLSGGGADGSLGLEAIKAAGGLTFAQEEATALQASMPRSAADTGCVDRVLSVDAIARELQRVAGSASRDADLDPGGGHVVTEGDLAALFSLLNDRTGVDFTHYKRNTIRRRLARRMALLGITNVADLLQRIHDDPEEADALFTEFLLRVTSFFRDPEAYEALRKTAFPAMVRNALPDGTLRIWVPACSTGEEAYSIAIALTEYLEETGSSLVMKILATDISRVALEKARAGTYPETISQELSPQIVRRFFQKTGSQYRISKSIRDQCVFAAHNVFRDPPFARLDLISCRNLLIYFDHVLQRRVLPLFHYALRPGGFLLLGSAETVGNHTDRFASCEREASLFARLPGPSSSGLDIALRDTRPPPHPVAPGPAAVGSSANPQTDILTKVDHILAFYAPPGVLVDEKLDVVQFRGDTSSYLRNPSGAPSLSLLRMVRDELAPGLKRALQAARERNTSQFLEEHLTDRSGVSNPVAIRVVPLDAGGNAGPYILILFQEVTPGPGRPASTPAEEGGRVLRDPDDQDARILQLESDLATARRLMQSVTEEHEATHEELKSANEEILASNEELQSMNEELQTAKEEMQSTNEELETMNEELQIRNRDLGLVNDDLTNLLAAAYIPVVMVSRDLRIRRFTAQAEKLLNLLPGDVGGLPTVLMSGYSLHEVKARYGEETFAGFIQKPFGASDLLPILRQILEAT